MESFEMDKGKFKPKASVALTHITEVGDLTPVEQTKFKKLFAQGFGVFKIQFSTIGLVSGQYKKSELEDHEPSTP